MSSIDLRDAFLFGVPVALSASTLAWLHFYPWNKGTKPLDRLAAYTVGTAVVVGFPVAAMFAARALHLPQDELFWALLLITNTVASGATVRGAYWVDGQRAVTPEEMAGAHAARDL
jgi:hypothetical protein